MDNLNKSIPIGESDANTFALDTNEAKSFGELHAESYQNADPFPHIVLDDFLPETIIQNILTAFPKETSDTDVIYKNKLGGFRKRQIYPDSCAPYAKNFFSFCNSAPMISFLEAMTGIEGLISDPHFDGGGFHEISKGGKLGIHADFRINKTLHLARRINVLIYLNEDWEEEFGGHLEIWDKLKTGSVKNVLPIFNRCVIFNTDASSYHGHPTPLTCPEHRSRKSIALYYYTASKEIYSELPSHSTMYVTDQDASLSTKASYVKLRMNNYLIDLLPPILTRNLKKLKKCLSRAKN